MSKLTKEQEAELDRMHLATVTAITAANLISQLTPKTVEIVIASMKHANAEKPEGAPLYVDLAISFFQCRLDQLKKVN